MRPYALPTLVAICLISLPVWSAAADAPPTPAGVDLTVPAEQWRLVWHDEFDGDKLDPNKWTAGLPFRGDDGALHHNPQYLSAVTDADVSVHDGMLSLTSRHVDVPGGRGNTYHYTEGFVHTNGKFRYTYGYAEARCRGTADQGPGFWPAFWTLTDGWPPENDVVELWSSGHMHQGFAFRTPPTTAPAGGGRRRGGRVEWISHHTESCPTGWHRYGLEWGPGYERFTFDGRVSQAVHGNAVPDRPMYLMLNSGVSSDDGRAPTEASRWPMTFDVDWARVYQKVDAEPVLFGFDPADATAWRLAGDAHLVDGALTLTGAASAEQTVYGLTPGARYTVAAQQTGDGATVVVRGHGATTFTAGPAETTIVVRCEHSGTTTATVRGPKLARG